MNGEAEKSSKQQKQQLQSPQAEENLTGARRGKMVSDDDKERGKDQILISHLCHVRALANKQRCFIYDCAHVCVRVCVTVCVYVCM